MREEKSSLSFFINIIKKIGFKMKTFKAFLEEKKKYFSQAVLRLYDIDETLAGHREVHLYDDSTKNLESFLDLKQDHPDVTFHAHHVTHDKDGRLNVNTTIF